jgi:hypothetical protein
MRNSLIIFLLLFCNTIINAQLVKGPKTGTLASGAAVNTGLMPEAAFFDDNKIDFSKLNVENPLLPIPQELLAQQTAPEGSNFFPDKSAAPSKTSISRPVLLKNFQGIPNNLGGGFPPDPIMAVGPNHVIACVNSAFRIFDKEGNVLKTIQAQTWVNNVAPASGPNDPQIVYDHFAGRWVMQWMTAPTTTQHWHIMSVSDDDNPMGVWYNYRTNAVSLGDSLSGNWGDYPAMGYDSVNIYLVSRQFTLSGSSYRYGKLRIFNKEQLYQNTGGAIMWKDFWDFRDPATTTIAPDNIRPANMFEYPGKYFLMNSSPYTSGIYVTLWTINNPATTPTISAANIPVTTYSTPPNADQLGGSTLLINTGGHRIRSNIIYRFGNIWATHAVGTGAGNAYSGVNYLRINASNNQVLEDVTFGQNEFWYYYPTISVAKDTSVIIGFSRSGLTEYVGAWATGRKRNDSPGLAPSVRIKSGEANYVLSDGSRNRWGDYNGTGLDPADSLSVWNLTEYAAAPVNTWGTWIGRLKMSPFPGAVISLNQTLFDFGPIELGSTSAEMNVKIMNNGVDTLVISNISLPSSEFVIGNMPVFPRTIGYYDSLELTVKFAPQSTGNKTDSLVITTNNTGNTTSLIQLKGKGYTITQTQRGVIYAGTGTADGGKLHIVNKQTGALMQVGATGYTQIVSMRVHPQTHQLIGLAPAGSTYKLVRINAAAGDAYEFCTITATSLKGMEILEDGSIWVANQTGSIFSVDVATGELLEVAFTGINIAGLAQNPLTGKLWASVRPPLTGKDRIFKINLPSGDTDLVGNTGFNAVTPDIIFDGNGNLFGIVGIGATINKFISIDTVNAVGTEIGSMGISSVQCIAMWPDSFQVGVNAFGNSAPKTYSLKQNYPNPFNPVTVISYQIPTNEFITVKIFDVLGREIVTLVNKEMKAGNYSVDWNANNVPSGMYFYRLTSGKFSETKKMILMK